MLVCPQVYVSEQGFYKKRLNNWEQKNEKMKELKQRGKAC